jgi:dipeptidase E
MIHVHWDSDWREELDRIDGLISPGGNTYVLLSRLQQSGLLGVLRKKLLEGLPYIGSSAGANVAGPNVLTTNDWNVIGLSEFAALGLVPFNINPHYVERGGSDAPFSETRELRIREYHQFNENPVVAIEDAGVIRVVDSSLTLIKGRAKVFLPNGQQYWMGVNEELLCEELMQYIPERPR